MFLHQNAVSKSTNNEYFLEFKYNKANHSFQFPKNSDTFSFWNDIKGLPEIN